MKYKNFSRCFLLDKLSLLGINSRFVFPFATCTFHYGPEPAVSDSVLADMLGYFLWIILNHIFPARAMTRLTVP